MINRQDMIDRFGEFELAELTDRDSHQEIDDVVLNRAIDDGVAEASSYLLPVGLADITPPYSLKIRVCDIARYYLYEEGMSVLFVRRRNDNGSCQRPLRTCHCVAQNGTQRPRNAHR